MDSSAKSTVSRRKRATRIHVTVFVAVFSLFVGSFGDLPVGAQQSFAALTAESPTIISVLDEIRSVRDADTTEGAQPVDTADAAGSAVPRTIVKTFLATAYCLKGQTASGVVVRRGIIAADPHVLPLGSVVRIRAGRYSGIYTVMDTGGKIRGRRIDIYMPTYAEAVTFGSRDVKVEVLRHGWEPDPDTARVD